MSTQSDALVAAVTAVSAAVAAVAQDPSDQIRILLNLASNGAPSATAADQATAALCRRATLIAVQNALASYQPTSYDEAAATRLAITTVMDAEILYAGDAEDTYGYTTLRQMRAYVVQTLTAIGASLPRLITVTRGRSLPALVLAYDLYGDATRADELIARVDPPHPAWFPLSFQALSS
jgi:prophage DNA circulation protein